MKLKSYFTPNVETAIRLARQELGPEAMLLETKKAPPEAQHLGNCEVVFAVEAPPDLPPAPPRGEEGGASLAALSAEIGEIRRQLDRMAAVVTRPGILAMPASLPTPDLSEVFAGLIASEVEPRTAQEVVSCLRAAGAAASGSDMRGAVASELMKRFSVDHRLGAGGDGPRTVALVGPSGSGKTTTLVKLATAYGLATRKPTQIISMDTLRIAAAEQLREYAAILGVGFLALDTPGALAQSLEEHRGKSLILIDTPGYGANDMDCAQELANFFSTRPDIDTHLILTASMKSADLMRVVERFEIFKPGKLIAARVDETETLGSVLNEAIRTDKPISFLATGQQIPEDLEPATKERVADLVLDRHFPRDQARAAAA